MNDDELKKFLNRIIPDEAETDSDEFKVVSQLIRLTLLYRDKLVSEKQSLSVQETRVAIELYWLALKRGHMPTNIDSKIEGLIRLWLKEINQLTY